MSDHSKIEWTDATWNPTRGCSRVSHGCENCYAEAVAARFSGPGQPYDGLARRADATHTEAKWTGKIQLVREALSIPQRWQRPRRIFVDSMSDLFHPDVPDGFIMDVWRVMASCPQHTFQILTKRPARMREWIAQWRDVLEGGYEEPCLVRGVEETLAAHKTGRGRLFASMLAGMGDPPLGCAFPTYDWQGGMRWLPAALPNVWLGVSCEDQTTANERVPDLMACAAAVRFISAEPLLGPIDLWTADHHTVDWVICGGESGPGARPMHPKWARALRDECRVRRIPFFFKQWGAWSEVPYDDDNPEEPTERERWLNFAGGHGFHGEDVIRVRRGHKKTNGRELDGRTWDEMP